MLAFRILTGWGALMSRWSCVHAAVSIAAFAGIGFSVALAGPVVGGQDSARFVFFSGTDLWRQGAFAHGGLLWSPGGIDREGFTLKAALAGGSYRYISGALNNAQVTGRELGAQILPGWRFKRDKLEVKVFAGVEIRDHHLSPDDPGSSLRGHYLGLRNAIDVWYEPTPNSMIAGDASISTIGSSFSARGALGWRVPGQYYLGPEIAAFGADVYKQYRLGLHATGIKTGDFEWSAAAGWASASDHNKGGYARIGILTRR